MDYAQYDQRKREWNNLVFHLAEYWNKRTYRHYHREKWQ